MKSKLNLEVLSIYSKLLTGSFCDITLPYKLLASQYYRFIFVFFKAACHANPGAGRNFLRSKSCNLRHIFLKLSNTAANKNILVIQIMIFS